MTEELQRIVRLEDKIQEVDRNMGKFDVSIRKFEEALKDFTTSLKEANATNQQIQITLVGMQAEISQNAKEVTEVKEKVNCLADDVKKGDEKGKIDLVAFAKENIVAIILGVVVILQYAGVIPVK